MMFSPRRPFVSTLFWIGAFLLFLAALFIYPSGAMTVFIFTFVRTAFCSLENWRLTRKLFWGDLIFFGVGMVVYRAIDRLLIFPWALNDLHFLIPGQPEYAMGITKNIFSKFSLIWDSLLVSSAGSLHLLWGNWGAIILGGFFIFMSVSFWGPKERRRHLKKESIERGGAIATLLMLSNLPCLLAEACFKIIGYRVLWVPTVMLMLLWVACLKRLSELMANKNSGKIAIYIATTAVILISFFAALSNVGDVVRNYHLELRFIRSQLTRMNLNEQNQIVVITVSHGETLIERRPPFEFSYMLTESQHVAPILIEGLRNRSDLRKDLTLQVIPIQPNMRISLQKTDFLINLNEMVPERKEKLIYGQQR